MNNFCISYWLFRKCICKPENLLEVIFAILICLCLIIFLQVAFSQGASLNEKDEGEEGVNYEYYGRKEE